MDPLAVDEPEDNVLISPSDGRGEKEATPNKHPRRVLVSSLPPDMHIDPAAAEEEDERYSRSKNSEKTSSHLMRRKEVSLSKMRVNSPRDESSSKSDFTCRDPTCMLMFPRDHLLSRSPNHPSYFSPCEREHYDLSTGEIRSFSNSTCSSCSRNIREEEKLPYPEPVSCCQYVPAPPRSDSSYDNDDGEVDPVAQWIKKENRFRRDYTPSPYVPYHGGYNSLCPSSSPEGCENEERQEFIVSRDGAVRTPIGPNSSPPPKDARWARYYSRSSREIRSVRSGEGMPRRPQLYSLPRERLSPSEEETHTRRSVSSPRPIDNKTKEMRQRAWSRVSSAACSHSASREGSHIPSAPFLSHRSSCSDSKTRNASLQKASRDRFRSHSGSQLPPSPQRHTAAPPSSVLADGSRPSSARAYEPPLSLPKTTENPRKVIPSLFPPSFDDNSEAGEENRVEAPHAMEKKGATAHDQGQQGNGAGDVSDGISFEEAYRKYVLEADGNRRKMACGTGGVGQPLPSTLSATAYVPVSRSDSSHPECVNEKDTSRAPYVLGSAYKKYLCSPSASSSVTSSHFINKPTTSYGGAHAGSAYNTTTTAPTSCTTPIGTSPNGTDKEGGHYEGMWMGRFSRESGNAISSTENDYQFPPSAPKHNCVNLSAAPASTFPMPPLPSSTSPRSPSAQSERSVSKAAATINKWRKILYEGHSPRLLPPPRCRSSAEDEDFLLSSNNGWQLHAQADKEGTYEPSNWWTPINTRNIYHSQSPVGENSTGFSRSVSAEENSGLGYSPAYFSSLTASQRRNDVHVRALMGTEEKKLKQYFSGVEEHSSRRWDEGEKEWNISTALSFVQERQRRTSLTPPCPQTPLHSFKTSIRDTTTTAVPSITAVIPTLSNAQLGVANQMNNNIPMLTGKENMNEGTRNSGDSPFRYPLSGASEAPQRDLYWVDPPSEEHPKYNEDNQLASTGQNVVDSLYSSSKYNSIPLRARSAINILDGLAERKTMDVEELKERGGSSTPLELLPTVGGARVNSGEEVRVPAGPGAAHAHAVMAISSPESSNVSALVYQDTYAKDLLQEVQKTKEKSEALARHLVRTLEEKRELQARLIRLQREKEQQNREENRGSPLSVSSQMPQKPRGSSYPSSARSSSLGGVQIALRTKEKELSIFEEEIHRLNGLLKQQQEQAAQMPQVTLAAHAMATAEVDAAMNELGMAHLYQRKAEERAEQLERELETAVSAIYSLDGKVVELQKEAMLQKMEEIRASVHGGNSPMKTSSTPQNATIDPGLASISSLSAAPANLSQKGNHALVELIVRSEELLRQCNTTRSHSESYVKSLQQTCTELRAQLQERGGKVEELQVECDTLRRDKNALRLYGAQWLQQLLDVKADAEIIGDIVRTSKADAQMVVANSIHADSFLNVSLSTDNSLEKEQKVVPFIRDCNASSRHFANLVMHDMKAVAKYLTALQRMNISEKEGYEMLERLANGKPLLSWEEEHEVSEESEKPHLGHNLSEDTPSTRGYQPFSMMARLSAPARFLIQQKSEFVLHAVEEALRAEHESSGSPDHSVNNKESSEASPAISTVPKLFLSSSPSPSLPRDPSLHAAFPEEEVAEAEELEDGETDQHTQRALSPNPTLAEAQPPKSLGISRPSTHRNVSFDTPDHDGEERWSELPDRQSLPSRERSMTAKPGEFVGYSRDSSLPVPSITVFQNAPSAAMLQTTPQTGKEEVKKTSHYSSSNSHLPKTFEEYDEPTLPFFWSTPSSAEGALSNRNEKQVPAALTTDEKVIETIHLPSDSTPSVKPVTSENLDAHQEEELPSSSLPSSPPPASSSRSSPVVASLPRHEPMATSTSMSESHPLVVRQASRGSPSLSLALSSSFSQINGSVGAPSESKDGICPSRRPPQQGLLNGPGMLPQLQRSFLHGTLKRNEDGNDDGENDLSNSSYGEAPTSSEHEELLAGSTESHTHRRPVSSSPFAPALSFPSPPPSMKGGDVHKRLAENEGATSCGTPTPLPASLEKLSEEEAAAPPDEQDQGASSTPYSVKESETPVTSEMASTDDTSFFSRNVGIKVIIPENIRPSAVDNKLLSAPSTVLPLDSPVEVPSIGERLPLPPSSSRGSTNLEGRRSGRLSREGPFERSSISFSTYIENQEEVSHPMESKANSSPSEELSKSTEDDPLPTQEPLQSKVEGRDEISIVGTNMAPMSSLSTPNEGVLSSDENNNAVRFSRRHVQAPATTSSIYLPPPATGNPFSSSEGSQPALPLDMPDKEMHSTASHEPHRPRSVVFQSKTAVSPISGCEVIPLVPLAVSPRFAVSASKGVKREGEGEGEEEKNKEIKEQQISDVSSPATPTLRLPLRPYTKPIFPTPRRLQLKALNASNEEENKLPSDIPSTSDAGMTSNNSSSNNTTPPIPLPKEEMKETQDAPRTVSPAGLEPDDSNVCPTSVPSEVAGEKKSTTPSSESLPVSTSSSNEDGTHENHNKEKITAAHHQTPARPDFGHSFRLNQDALSISPIAPRFDRDDSSSRFSIHSLHHGGSSTEEDRNKQQQPSHPNEGTSTPAVPKAESTLTNPHQPRSISPLLAKIRSKIQLSGRGSGDGSALSPRGDEKKPASPTKVPLSSRSSTSMEEVRSARDTVTSGPPVVDGEYSRSARSSMGGESQGASGRTSVSTAERREKLAQLLERARMAKKT